MQNCTTSHRFLYYCDCDCDDFAFSLKLSDEDRIVGVRTIAVNSIMIGE